MGDARDEIVVATNNDFLALLNGTTSEIIWNVSIGANIKGVEFGHMTGDASLDMAVQ